jgi:DNA repair exonuclease SbcCD nuclease subunit
MGSLRIAHLADLHLGFRQYERQTPKGGNQREADVAEAFRRAVGDVLAQRPDLVLVAGDVFHSVRPTNAAILFFFQQVQRLRGGLPDAPVVVIAGNHDTPRSSETGSILRLYETLGVHVVADRARRLAFPRLDCAVLAVPHEALIGAERPALRPEPGARYNVLVTHGETEGLFPPDRVPLEFGGALLTRGDLGLPQWDYVALGHYHVTHEIAPNCWYAGSLDYVSTNVWGELREEADRRRTGKGYLLVELPGARVHVRHVAPVRSFADLPAIRGEGLTAKEIDARIAAAVEGATQAIDGQVVRLVVHDASRATARDLDHVAIRGYKGRALHFLLDVRRPVAARVGAAAAPGRRLTLPETLRDYLSRRPLDADVDRTTFVELGARYLEEASATAEASAEAGEEPGP